MWKVLQTTSCKHKKWIPGTSPRIREPREEANKLATRKLEMKLTTQYLTATLLTEKMSHT